MKYTYFHAMLCWLVTTGVTVHSRLVEEAAFVLYAPADPRHPTRLTIQEILYTESYGMVC